MLRLDDLAHLSSLDSGKMLATVSRFPDFLSEMSNLSIDSMKPRAFRNIVLMGMGGSASAADVLFDWLGEKIKVPVQVIRNPVLPGFARRETLYLAFSYSGETWETLAAFRSALGRGCQVGAVGSGGRLEALCRRKRLPFLKVLPGMVPRAALGNLIAAGALMLQSFSVVENLQRELEETGRELKRVRSLLRAEVPTRKNQAKRLAMRLKGHLPVVYCLQRMSSVGRRAKNQFAENAKVLAKWEILPESGHNDIETWPSQTGRAIPLILRDVAETEKEKAVLNAFRFALEKVGRTKSLEVRTRARSNLGRLLGPIMFLDYVSVYLAFLRGVDPTPTNGIRIYRGALGPFKR